MANEPRINDRIRAKEVRLVDPEGGQIGIKTIEEALWLADQLELDLVEVAPDAKPPVCRLMDYGKFKYEQSVRQREARKKQTRTVIKEVQFRPKIGDADFDVKMKRVERFLGEGDKVKVTMRFRGREVTHPEIGRAILQRLVDAVGDLGVVESMPRLEGKQMTMVLGPVKRPKVAETAPGGEATGDGNGETDRKNKQQQQQTTEDGAARSEEPAVVAGDTAATATDDQGGTNAAE